jgi:thiamine-monophosphate kinase
MNEFEFIRSLRRQTRPRRHSARLVAGIGDDASVIRQKAGRDLVVTTDLLVEDIDFCREATEARALGHKSLAVSLSDIAAMGGRPLWSLLSIGIPAESWRTRFTDEFYEGYFALADRFGVTLSGGDVSETKSGIVIDSIVMGEVASGAAVLRSGARPGDQLFVTGTLGGAAAGLKLIQMGARVSAPGAAATGSLSADEDPQRSETEAIQTLLLRQLRPSPRVGWGMVLGEERLATSMIDISDGLSSDLKHLCDESGNGALIQSASLPLDNDVVRLCGRRALDPLALALHGGEDFELLFTVRPDNISRLPKRVDGVEISCIGEITNASGIIRLTEKDRVWDLQPKGFEHFKSSA